MRIFITGASSGIGKQLALDYHAQGFEVWGVGRNEARLAKLSEQGIHTLRCDLSELEKVRQTCASLPSFDLVILCAGDCEYLDKGHFDAQLFERVWRANVGSVVNCIDALWQKFNAGAQLAIVGSLARLLPFTRAGAYGSSKAALYYLANALHTDLDEKRVSVHYIQPGFVRTPLTDKNDFPMMELISTEQASAAIQKGLARSQRIISFPWRFSLLLQLLSLFPLRVQTWLCRKIAKQ